MAQLQHNMWVTNSKSAPLSIITGGGKWVEITVHADALYQRKVRLTAARLPQRYYVRATRQPTCFGVGRFSLSKPNPSFLGHHASDSVPARPGGRKTQKRETVAVEQPKTI